jgi:LysR family hca operon transcriptional activator
MELKNLRYFVAVAEADSLTHAAEDRLPTADPSASRHIRKLESDLGVLLMARSPQGMKLTPAGRAFLNHARLILSQVERAREAMQQISRPARNSFTLGFLVGYETAWLPEVVRILRPELREIDLVVYSRSTVELMRALLGGEIDAAFLRPEPNSPRLTFRSLVREPIVAVLPSNNPLANRRSIRPQDLATEGFISIARTSGPTLRAMVDEYAAQSGIKLRQACEAHDLPTAISLVLSTPGISLLPRYAENLLPLSAVIRPLEGRAPEIALAIGYNTTKVSPILEHLLSRLEGLVTWATLNQSMAET